MISINIYYYGKGNSAKDFAMEMESSGIAKKIREEDGNIKYEYYYPKNDEEYVLLIDQWENEEALNNHHQTPMMQEIIRLREKYDLHMKVERFVLDDEEHYKNFIRK